MPHSCAVVDLDRFFEGSDLRELFDRFVAAVGRPVVVNATKSRITLQARMRFAGIEQPRKRYLLAYFLLTRPVESERLARVEFIPPYYYVHRLRLHGPDDIDAELERWLVEAYEIGEQRHVTDPGWVKQRRPPRT
jgi:hypothetical protein